MTFDQFKTLALNPPVKEMDRIFVLERVTVDELDGMKRQHYPSYEVRRYVRGFGRSVEEAEAVMRGIIEASTEESEDVFCYYIKGYPLGQGIVSEYHLDSCRMYDAKGVLVDWRNCSDTDFEDRDEDYEYTRFRGRPQERMRFKKGDIVEFMWCNEVCLGFVVELPPSVERAWQIEQRCLERGWRGASLDWSDDSYIVLTTSDYASHHHIDCMDIFEPHFPIPPYMRRRLEERYRKFLKKDSV